MRACVRACVRACTRVRERERASERALWPGGGCWVTPDRMNTANNQPHIAQLGQGDGEREWPGKPVCVRACVRARARERESGRASGVAGRLVLGNAVQCAVASEDTFFQMQASACGPERWPKAIRNPPRHLQLRRRSLLAFLQECRRASGETARRRLGELGG